MKTIKLFFTILTLMATISACKKDAEVGPQGETGTTGPIGPTGPTGNANLYTFRLHVPKSKWKFYDLDSLRCRAHFDNNELPFPISTQDAPTTDAVFVDVLTWTWNPLPFTFSHPSDTMQTKGIPFPSKLAYSIGSYGWGNLILYIEGIDSSKLSLPTDTIYYQIRILKQ